MCGRTEDKRGGESKDQREGERDPHNTMRIA